MYCSTNRIECYLPYKVFSHERQREAFLYCLDDRPSVSAPLGRGVFSLRVNGEHAAALVYDRKEQSKVVWIKSARMPSFLFCRAV